MNFRFRVFRRFDGDLPRRLLIFDFHGSVISSTPSEPVFAVRVLGFDFGSDVQLLLNIMHKTFAEIVVAAVKCFKEDAESMSAVDKTNFAGKSQLGVGRRNTN